MVHNGDKTVHHDAHREKRMSAMCTSRLDTPRSMLTYSLVMPVFLPMFLTFLTFLVPTNTSQMGIFLINTAQRALTMGLYPRVSHIVDIPVILSETPLFPPF